LTVCRLFVIFAAYKIKKNMKSIQFNQEITFEQYQMAVRVLEAIGLEVQKNEMPTLPLEVIEGIEQGWQELREGKGIASADVHKKARILCTGR
jgi:hypothetical protein